MDDLISRKQAIDAFDGVKVDEECCTEYDIGYNDGIDFAVSKLSVLPSAQQWILCNESLPAVGVNVLVCYELGKIRYVSIGELLGDGEFHGCDDEYLTEEGRKRKAFAWMPLPEAYKGEDHG